MLSQHPELRLSPRKELHFFDDEKRNWAEADYKDLAAQSSTRFKCGDFTPIYMYWPNSIARIHSYNKDAKIIVLLRNPMYRAFSHWRMERIRGLDNLSFADAISPIGRSRVETSLDSVHRVYSYVERGLYSKQLKNIYRYFPRSAVLVARTDSLYRDPNSRLSTICRHIEIEELHLPHVGHVSPVEIPADYEWQNGFEQSRQKLFDLFIDDLFELTNLVDVDITDWLEPWYEESF